jgi:predicted Rossmann fold flavoprotein
MTAIVAAREGLAGRVVVLDGARRLGAKILISGGGRCNVTNAIVSERDFWGGNRNVVKQVLRAFPVAETRAFFGELGVALHEEEDGKLFPDSHRASTVLGALLAEAERRGVRIETGARVRAVERDGAGFRVQTPSGPVPAGRVVLATGGRSVPKTGSDGGGYALAAALGHTLVPTVPALAPLVLSGAAHARLRGVTQAATLTMRDEQGTLLRLSGSMLWTHFGVSGPVALDLSRHWHRVQERGGDARVGLNLTGRPFETVERELLAAAAQRGRLSIGGWLAEDMPSSAASALAEWAGVDGTRALSALTREERRRVVHSLVDQPLPVTGSRGFEFAEATAGGVSLDEIDPRRMESRVCPGLYLVGEMLDVDGRLGGFNFQWAWSSGCVAGRAAAVTRA